ncbi:MAG: hypothetical protein A2Y33_12920 [Spirochaetes bacterium GWF1_51_8]|nr:MAG: hypothetical protein A2Y33_12920 [Spirochaetes bacterium GWF1_51_8]
MKKIPFALPEIGEREIEAVTDVMRSDWITTGPKVREFEQNLADYCGVSHAQCLSSATAGMELLLRLYGIGPGDEVITTPYTFAATANVIVHTGAVPVFADVCGEDFNIDPVAIEKLISPKTKAVITVDFGGLPVNYGGISTILRDKANLFRPSANPYQRGLHRPLWISDAAHSLGAVYGGRKTGGLADFSVFSFHAVKNLTTAEGGAMLYDRSVWENADDIYRGLRLMLLHGQSKDALDKLKAGNWFYAIELPGYKYNMTDMSAAMGISQLARYEDEILAKRKRICGIYTEALAGVPSLSVPILRDGLRETSYQLYPLRLKTPNIELRNAVIAGMSEKGIALNVHFIPLPLHPYYEKLGYMIDKYPTAKKLYESEISLPVYSRLSEDDALYIAEELKKTLKNLEERL